MYRQRSASPLAFNFAVVGLLLASACSDDRTDEENQGVTGPTDSASSTTTSTSSAGDETASGGSSSPAATDTSDTTAGATATNTTPQMNTGSMSSGAGGMMNAGGAGGTTNAEDVEGAGGGMNADDTITDDIAAADDATDDSVIDDTAMDDIMVDDDSVAVDDVDDDGAMNADDAINADDAASDDDDMANADDSMSPGDDPTGLCQAMGWATRDGRNGGEVAVTGGGNAEPVVVSSFGDLQMYAQDGQPRVIHVDGDVGSGWSGTSGDRLKVGSNKTIIGIRPGTELRAPIHINDSTNVIVRNLVIRGPGSNSDQAWDNINIEGSSKNVWIDHCEFWDGQDGNADVVKGADNVTFTWNIFGYRTGGEHNFSNLVASSDDEPESEGKLNITLMFNWFTGVAQRQPRCRYGNIHVVNNLFSRDGQASDYGISAGKDCKVLTEANHFIEINTPIYTSHASGSSANELRGDNIFENTSGNTDGYGTAFEPPYEYASQLVPANEVKALVEASVGATLDAPPDCN